MLIAASHLVIGLIGAVLLYVALFLRETEEGTLQNRLEKLWVEIDDLSKAALSKQTAFLQRVSALANSALNRLFGARFFSAGAVSASFCFSVGSILLFLPRHHNYAAYLIAGVLSFLLGLSPTPLRYLGLLWIPGSIIAMLYHDRSFIEWNWTYWLDEFLPLVFLFGGGFLSDVLFIAVCRWCLRTASKFKNGWKITALMTFNGCVGLILVSPLLWGISDIRKYGGIDSSAETGLALMGASNLVAGVISVLFVLLALTALMHLAIWPILERPIYSLQRFGVARNPKLLGATSVTCLIFAWPHSPIIQGIAKLIHGG